MAQPCVVCHGGVGGRPEDSDGCRRAAERGLAALAGGAHALDAAVEARVVLEDDPRYNAGTGANLRLDGHTIELDAAVMDSDGRIGAVAAVRSVKNPVRVARRVLDTSHVFLAGDGATRFAELCGLRAEVPPTPGALEDHARRRKAWAAGELPADAGWSAERLRESWNLPASRAEALGCDTVGAVVRDSAGRFGLANSTGGTSWALLGRVGDSPLPGCGYWAGPAGAVAATGIGEEIIRKVLCRTVYDWLAAGASPQDACARGVKLLPTGVAVGLIAVTPSAHGWAADRGMPVAALT